MNKLKFKQILENRIMVLDGATGTLLQKRGMPNGVCPELWVSEHPEVLVEVQKEYVNAGSDAIYSFTLGGNRTKLDEYGLGDRTIELNKKLAQLSREVVGANGFVAGDIGPTGCFIKPFGDMLFEEAVNIYKEQVRGLLEGGADFFVIETMVDIQEARAALLAVKESCDLPVCVSMTFDESGRTLTGTDPVTALITLQSLGADAVGCNCSTGPDKMLEVIRAIKPYAKVPVLAKPNAGLPRLIDGETVFDMGTCEYGSFMKDFIHAGVNMIGGCCGTSPEFIKEICSEIKGMSPLPPKQEEYSALTSSRKTVFTGFNKAVAIVGERINPTGKKKLQEELREGKNTEIRKYAIEQMEKGAAVLDVNVGMPGIDEKAVMVKVVELLSSTVDAPLCIDSSSPEVLEAALRVYPGRALINSISAESIKLQKLLPIAAKYGAMFILLPLSDEGVPSTADERFELVKRVYSEAEKYGFGKNDIIVDGLVMTVSSDQRAALETLKVIEWCTRTFGCGSIIGLSNVSFGLPERTWVNTAFLAMAIGHGLTMAIANPSGEMLMNIKLASDVLVNKDENSRSYIAHFTHKAGSQTGDNGQNASKPTLDRIYDAVIKGDKDIMKLLAETAVKEGSAPSSIVDDYLIPAITQVGYFFDKKEFFLPQLIQSAEAMKAAFEYLEPLLKKDGSEGGREGIPVVLATVKGDIHDIGKNIVALMLKNYGFKVYDLGKDVSAHEIVSKAREYGAKIIGLSALMTTTMVEMKEVINLARKEGLDSKFMVGGAVVNQQYADEIGADGYSEDAYRAVVLAQKLSGN